MRGFDKRLVRTVNKANENDALRLFDIADELGVSLLKFQRRLDEGTGRHNPELAMTPPGWVEFCNHLGQVVPDYERRVSYRAAILGPDQSLKVNDCRRLPTSTDRRSTRSQTWAIPGVA